MNKLCSNCRLGNTCVYAHDLTTTSCASYHAKTIQTGPDTFQEIKLFPQTSTTIDVKLPPTPEELAEAHWSYVGSLLKAYGHNNTEKDKFVYISAFIHGYKHGVESCTLTNNI